MTPRLNVREVRLYERDVRLRMPFRFGAVTLTGAPQAFARVRIALADGREGWGAAAEMLAPKWFDKDPRLTNEQNLDQLRASLATAARLYRDAGSDTAFGLFAACHPVQRAACSERGLNALVAGYGPALLDRAILDALCRLHDVSFYDAARANLPGLDARLAPDLAGFDLDAFLAARRPAAALHARHTVGLVDPITAADQAGGCRVGDGLPETLEEVVAVYGHRYFKLKVGGEVAADVARLTAIASVLDRLDEPYVTTLDGNEQYDSIDAAVTLWEAMEKTPALTRLVASVLFVEQPVTRAHALERDVTALAARRPVIIDESDDTLDAFPRARALGYRGVSSKTCKGLYKSLLNAARCARWNAAAAAAEHFMSAEDLTTQAGLAVQQDLALVSLLGLTHVERNGHHYVNGMAAVSGPEPRAFLAAHPDLYVEQAGVVRLRIAGGRVAIGSLACPGFAAGAEPDWTTMRTLA
jgi:hypothetical protein